MNALHRKKSNNNNNIDNEVAFCIIYDKLLLPYYCWIVCSRFIRTAIVLYFTALCIFSKITDWCIEQYWDYDLFYLF